MKSAQDGSRDGKYAYYGLDNIAGFYRRDNASGTTRFVSTAGGAVSISADGERAVSDKATSCFPPSLPQWTL